MFGYIKTDEPYLYKKDDVLYKSLYCGVCKAIGSTCSQAARLSLTYDIAFLSAVAHNITDKDVVIEKKCCIAHPIIKRPIAKKDELTEKLAEINTILAYYKVCDDVYDNGKGRFKRLVLGGGFRRAKKKLPEIEKIVKTRYAELNESERRGEKSVDMVCDPFSNMLAEISDGVLDEYKTEITHKLFYAVGKWIYLIDALDDYDKDIKKKDYNVFSVAYGRSSAKELIEKDGEELSFIFSALFSDIDEYLKQIKFYFNKDLIVNILSRGIKKTFENVIKRIVNEK